jgi:hypothetical protein
MKRQDTCEVKVIFYFIPAADEIFCWICKVFIFCAYMNNVVLVIFSSAVFWLMHYFHTKLNQICTPLEELTGWPNTKHVISIQE